MAAIFDALFKGFADALAFFYKLIPSYGIAIVLLTIAVRLVLFPLTAKQARSMQKMQQVQPELKRLQAKYKNDRQKLNEEMMKFYRENNINPLAGCLPLLLQLPLFIVLYRVIAGLTATLILVSLVGLGTTGVSDLKSGYELTNPHVTTGTVEKGVVKSGNFKADVVVDGTKVGHIEKPSKVVNNVVATATVYDEKGNKLGVIEDIRLRFVRTEGNPKYIPKSSDLYKALKADGGEMRSFGMDLSKRATDDHGGFLDALPYWVLIALVVSTGYYQQRQMTARNPQAAQNPQAQMMGKIFPIVFGFISLNIAAGVVVYFVVSNLWQIGQQALIFRKPATVTGGGGGSGGSGGGAIEAKGTPKPKPGGDAKAGGAKPAKPSSSNGGNSGGRGSSRSGRTGDGGGRARPSSGAPRKKNRR